MRLIELGAGRVGLIAKPQLTFWLGPGQILKILQEERSTAYAEEQNLIAAAVVEIFVRQHKGLGVFKFTKLPKKGDHLCLPSHRRARFYRYVVTDVAQNGDPECGLESGAGPLHGWVYVSFFDEI